MAEAAASSALSVSDRVRQDQNRADFLEFLYYADGRDKAEHPLANSYTGLFQDYCYAVGEAVLASLSSGWHTAEGKDIAQQLFSQA